MLIVCYGITKSGSTLTFELIKGMLASAGHVQERLPDGLVNPGHRINYVQPVDSRRLHALLEAAGDRSIAVKTHAGFGEPLYPTFEELQRTGRLQIVASYRDPRDICLSLMDAGVESRAAGKREFSEVTDLASAVPRVLEQILKFRKWTAVPGTLRLDYDLVAFSPDEAIARLEQCLQIKSDAELAKKHAFDQAFTQKNKGKRHRAQEELSAQQYEELTRTFSAFLENVVTTDNEDWFVAAREEILARLALRRRRKARRKV